MFDLKRSNENGELGIYFELHDQNGMHLASIQRSQIYPVWKNLDSEQYVLDGSDTVATFIDRSNSRTLCEIRRGDAASTELDVAVQLYMPNGALFDAEPDHTNIGSIVAGRNIIKGAKFGIHIA